MRGLTPAAACLLIAVACGGSGGGTPTAPSSPPAAPNLPSGGACGAIGLMPSASIVNGSACSPANAAVVLVNLRDANDVHAGACSGTIIAPRAVLTAAHCVDGNVVSARIWLGSGDQIPARSFTRHPAYREGDVSTDVAVVQMNEDLPRTPIPLLVSRDAQVGEAAVIAGWGRDENSVGTTLRAGVASITSVTPAILQTQYSTTASSVCAGDSGGSLLLSEGGVWAIAAVTSANSTLFCSFGANYFAAIRSPATAEFIFGLVSDAARR